MLIFWGEKNRGQPWLAIFWLLVALGIWSYIFGLWGTDSGEEAVEKAIQGIEEAKVLREKSVYERLKAQGSGIAARREAERLNDWKKNFPWQPTTDDAVEFDPDRHILHRVRPYGEAQPASNPIGIAEFAVADHNVALRRFFQNDARFTKQFEKAYHILADYGMTNNPVLAGRTFNALWDYHQANQQAQSKPDETAMEPVMQTLRRMNSETGTLEVVETKIREWKPYPPHPETGKTMTWSERTEYLKDGIAGSLLQSEWLSSMPYPEEEAQAFTIRDRLIDEVEQMADIPNPGFIGMLSPEEDALNSDFWSLLDEGHPEIDTDILVPYVGWAQGMERYEEEFEIRMAQSVAEGDPSLKALRPDLFPLADVVENVLVDRNGDPLRNHEGFQGFLLKDGEPFPLWESSDGSLRIPTPSEVEEMHSWSTTSESP